MTILICASLVEVAWQLDFPRALSKGRLVNPDLISTISQTTFGDMCTHCQKVIQSTTM